MTFVFSYRYTDKITREINDKDWLVERNRRTKREGGRENRERGKRHKERDKHRQRMEKEKESKEKGWQRKREKDKKRETE